MAETDAGLTEVEAGIAALRPPQDLLDILDGIEAPADKPNRNSVRHALARGIILNRLGLPESGLTSLQMARRQARLAGEGNLAATISREIARVHSWRGETAASALELLRSMVEAHTANQEEDAAAATAEFGRINLETGRYEAALDAIELAEASMALLPDRARSRLPVNRREALLALGRHQECLDGIDELIAVIPEAFQRDGFVARVVKARAQAALGMAAEAKATAEDAGSRIDAEPHSYERAELALLDGILIRETEPERAVAELETALDRFIDDDLPRHEFDARAVLAETLAAIGRQEEAEACIVAALRRAEVRRLPAMADRIRASAVAIWRPSMITELAPEEGVGPGAAPARFLTLEVLGTGGFGEVHRAIDLETGAEVAIKRFARLEGADPASAKVALATVRNEIAASQRIPNRFVARTRYVSMSPDGAVTVVQDYVPGPTLRSVMEEESLDFGHTVAIAATIARTLATLHAVGLAHRDLKPDNVVLRNGAHPVLIDLGLAQLAGRKETTAGLGTLDYAPPEQLSGAPADERWLGREDVYALGRTIEEMMKATATEAKGGLLGRFTRYRNSGFDKPLAALIETMTDPDASRRTVDLNHLAEHLDQAGIRAASR